MKTQLIIGLMMTTVLFSGKAQMISNGFAIGTDNLGGIRYSGGYEANTPEGKTPDDSHPWQHLFVIRHSNPTNNHQLQIGASYAENDRLFFRKLARLDIDPSYNPSWIELATRGTNTFSGNQTFMGNIGIGTTNPTAKLEVNGDISVGSEDETKSKLGYGSILRFKGLNAEGWDPTWIARYNSEVDRNELRVNIGDNIEGDDKFVIGANWWSDNTWYPAFTVYNNGIVEGRGEFISAGNNNGFRVTGETTDKINAAPWYGLGLSNLNLNPENNNNAVQLAGYYGLNLQTGGGRMVINAAGNVGIGTSNPQNALDVKGTIRATEIKVESVDRFADFVFASGYQLPTLEAVEQHIKEKGHLAEIPSAQEVKENGMSLVDMQVKLLQKVEEMTLYIIQQQKEIETLKTKVKSLEGK